MVKLHIPYKPHNTIYFSTPVLKMYPLHAGAIHVRGTSSTVAGDNNSGNVCLTLGCTDTNYASSSNWGANMGF